MSSIYDPLTITQRAPAGFSTPDFSSYNDWSVDNANDPDELNNRAGYADYVRKQYIANGNFDDPRNAVKLEESIRQNTRDAALAEVEGAADRIDSMFAPKAQPLDTKLAFIKQYSDSNSEEWKSADTYLAHQASLMQSGAEGNENPLTEERTMQYQQEAEELAGGAAYQKALRTAVDRGDMAMARLTDENGESYIHSGKLLDTVSFKDAMQQSVAMGGMSYSDAASARSLYSVDENYNEPYHKVRRWQEQSNVIEKLSLKNKDLGKSMQGLQALYAEKEDGGEPSPEFQAKEEAAIAQVYESLISTGAYDKDTAPDLEDVSRAASNMAQMNNFYNSDAEDAESEEVGKNIQRIGYNNLVMHPAAMLNKKMFDASIKANADLTPSEINMLTRRREFEKEQNFADYSERLTNDSVVGDKWIEALQIGRTNGQKDADTLDQFINDEDNYSSAKGWLSGIWSSVEEGVSDLAAAVGVLTGNTDWALPILQQNAADRTSRREMSALFGKEYGFGRNAIEMLAPVLTDMAATALLAIPSGGVGGAAYLLAKQGATIGAKGLVKGLVTNSFRRGATNASGVWVRESTEEAAERLVTANLIKGSSESVKLKGAKEVLDSFNNLTARRWGIDGAVFVPSATRDGGMTYGSVYTQLQKDNPDATHEENHDKAMGAAIMSGLMTGLTTVVFGRLGFGGVEDSLVRGATYGQLKRVLEPLVKKTGTTFDDAVEGAYKDALKQTGMFGLRTGLAKAGLKGTTGDVLAEGIKGAVSEAPEEALQEFLGGLISDAATDSETPFAERINQSFNAALYGAVLGGGITSSKSLITAGNQLKLDQQVAPQMLNSFEAKVAAKLEESGSPLMAEQVRNVLRSTADTRVAAFERARQEYESDQEQAPFMDDMPVDQPAEPQPSPERQAVRAELEQAELEFEALAEANPVEEGAEPNPEVVAQEQKVNELRQQEFDLAAQDQADAAQQQETTDEEVEVDEEPLEEQSEAEQNTEKRIRWAEANIDNNNISNVLEVTASRLEDLPIEDTAAIYEIASREDLDNPDDVETMEVIKNYLDQNITAPAEVDTPAAEVGPLGEGDVFIKTDEDGLDARRDKRVAVYDQSSQQMYGLAGEESVKLPPTIAKSNLAPFITRFEASSYRGERSYEVDINIPQFGETSLQLDSSYDGINNLKELLAELDGGNYRVWTEFDNLAPDIQAVLDRDYEGNRYEGLATLFQEWIPDNGVTLNKFKGETTDNGRSQAQIVMDQHRSTYGKTARTMLQAVASSPDSEFAEVSQLILANHKDKYLDAELEYNANRKRAEGGTDAGILVDTTFTPYVAIHEYAHVVTQKELDKNQFSLAHTERRDGKYWQGIKEVAAGRGLSDKGHKPTEYQQEIARLYDLAKQTVPQITKAGENPDPTVRQNRKLPKDQQVPRHVAYGLGNMHEFVAQTLSSKDMQEFLNNIPDPQADGKTLWDRFMDAVSKIMGVPVDKQSVLASTLKATNDLGGASMATTQEAGSTQSAPEPLTSSQADFLSRSTLQTSLTNPNNPNDPSYEQQDQASLAELVDSKPVYHSTNLTRAKQLIKQVEGGNTELRDVAVTDNDGELGQLYKGYLLEFDSTKVNGNPTEEGAALELNKSVKGSLQAIIVPNQRGLNALTKVKGIEKRFDLDNTTQVEGGFRIPRRAADPVVEQEAEIPVITNEDLERVMGEVAPDDTELEGEGPFGIPQTELDQTPPDAELDQTPDAELDPTPDAELDPFAETQEVMNFDDMTLSPEQDKQLASVQEERTRIEDQTVEAQDATEEVFNNRTLDSGVSQLDSTWESDLSADEILSMVVEDAIPYIRNNTAAEVDIVIDETISSPMRMQGNTMTVNPWKVGNEIAKMGGDGSNTGRLLDSIMSEESAHYGGFMEYDAATVKEMADAVGVDGLAEVAQQYYNENPEMAEQSIQNLRSEDPAIAQKEAATMVEEQLRMKTQRATRGFTTEEDVLFLRSNPKMLDLTARYFEGAINKVAANFDLKTNPNSVVNGQVNKMIGQLRSIKARHRAGNASLTFNPNNPSQAFETMAAMQGETSRIEQQLGMRGLNTSAGSDPISEAGEDFLEKVGLGDIGMSLPMFDSITDMPRGVRNAIKREDNFGFESEEEALANLMEEAENWWESWEVENISNRSTINRYINQRNKTSYADRQENKRLMGRELATSTGKGKAKSEFSSRSFDFDHTDQMMVVPMMEVGEYNAPSNLFAKYVLGDPDVRLTRLHRIYKALNRQGGATLKQFDHTFKRLLTETYGEDKKEYPTEDIATAIGSNKGVIVPPETLNDLEDQLDQSLQAVDADPTLDYKEKKYAKQVANQLHQNNVEIALKAEAQKMRDEQRSAMERIQKDSPDLARHIHAMRTDLIDSLSGILKDDYNLRGALGIQVDANMGIYITRSYKMFTELGYRDKLRASLIDTQKKVDAELANVDTSNMTDEEVEQLLETSKLNYDELQREGIEFFETATIDSLATDPSRIKAFMDAGMSEADAQAEAYVTAPDVMLTKEYRDASYHALLEFIDQYANPEAKMVATNTAGYKVLMDNLREKKDIPEQLRKVLGENTDPEQGLNNLLRTYATVFSMVNRQNFLRNIVAVGTASQSPNPKRSDKFLLTALEFKEAKEEEPEKYDLWRSVRGDAPVSEFDPLGNYFAPPEMIDHLNAMTKPYNQDQNMTSNERLGDNLTKFLHKLTGLSMATKTLGSVSWAQRNMIGNLTVFPMMNGWFRPDKILKQAKLVWRKRNADEAYAVDAEIQELVGLDILESNMRMTIMKDLLRGTGDVATLQEEINDLTSQEEKLELAGMKGKAWDKVKKTGTRIAELGDSIDGFYKMAYFYNELEVLKEAKKEAPKGSRLDVMSDYQLKQEAAHKVNRTSQSASYRVAIAQKLSSSPLGLLIAPFIGFTADMFRVPVGIFKVANEEMKSGNSVLVKRGTKRLAGLTGTLATTAALPTLFAQLFGGLDDEDRTTLGEALPPFLKGHSIYYFKMGDDLKQIDLTYTNPVAMIVDPNLRGVEQLIKGEYSKATIAMLKGYIADTFMNEQILAGTMGSWWRNKDELTGKPIYDERLDNFGEIAYKTFKHIYEKAYEPDTFKRLKLAAQRLGGDTGEGIPSNETALGVLASGLKPAKWRDVDLQKEFTRLVYAEKEAKSAVRDNLNGVFRKKPMSEDTIAGFYRDYYEDEHKLNTRMYKFVKSFMNMGVDEGYLRNALVKSGYGKRRVQALFDGYTERPSLTPQMMKNLEDRKLINRAGTLYNTYVQSPEFRQIE